MITYNSQLASVSYAGCVGAHFGLHQLATYIDKKHKQIREKRHDTASDHTKNQAMRIPTWLDLLGKVISRRAHMC